jgi:uncharacterized protein
MIETVLVTGASSGIGKQLATLFAADGSRLILVARSEEKLQSIAKSLRDRFQIEAKAIVMDLTKPNAPLELCKHLNDQAIEIDVLVNNAGFGALGRFNELSLERQMQMLQLNIVSLTELARRLVPGMVARRRGGILNVGSMAAYQAGPNMTVYYATKAYVLSFSEGLREELLPFQINVTLLAPGPTKTGFGNDSGMESLSMFTSNAMGVESVSRAGYDGFRRGQAVVIPGWRNQALSKVVKFMPRAWTRKLAMKMQPIA